MQQNNTNTRKPAFTNVITADKKPQSPQMISTTLLEEIKQQLVTITRELVKIKKAQASQNELLETLSKKIVASSKVILSIQMKL